MAVIRRAKNHKRWYNIQHCCQQHTDIATYRLNQPRGQFSEKKVPNYPTTGGSSGPQARAPWRYWATGGGLLCLDSLEEGESQAPWLVFLVSIFPFSQATQAEQFPSCGPLSTGRPGLRPNSQCFVCQCNSTNILVDDNELAWVSLQRTPRKKITFNEEKTFFRTPVQWQVWFVGKGMKKYTLSSTSLL